MSLLIVYKSPVRPVQCWRDWLLQLLDASPGRMFYCISLHKASSEMSGCGAFTVFMNVIPALLQYHLHFSVSGLILLPQIRMQTPRKKSARTDLHKLAVRIPLSLRLYLTICLLVFFFLFF